MGSNPYSKTGAQFALDLEPHRALDTVTDATLKSLIGDRCFTPLVFTSTASPSISITGTPTYSVNGFFYTSAVSSATFTDTTVQAAGTTKAYLLSIDANGSAVTITNGLAIPSGQEPSEARLPPLPAGHAPLGAVRITTDASTTFTPGTTNLDATGVTAEFFSLSAAVRSLP